MMRIGMTIDAPAQPGDLLLLVRNDDSEHVRELVLSADANAARGLMLNVDSTIDGYLPHSSFVVIYRDNG